LEEGIIIYNKDRGDLNYCNAFCMDTIRDSMNERQLEIVNTNSVGDFFNLMSSMRLFMEYQPEKDDHTDE